MKICWNLEKSIRIIDAFTHHSEPQFVIIYESFPNARNTRKTPGNAFNTTAGYFHKKCSNP